MSVITLTKEDVENTLGGLTKEQLWDLPETYQEHIDKEKLKELKAETKEYFDKFVDTNKDKSTKPFIIQHFSSLEGEGGDNAVGLTTLFLRLNKCNLSCKFCDTAFSIQGNPKYNLVEANSYELTNFLNENYSEADKKFIHSCSITGGEPLLHINEFSKIIKYITKSFKNINHIIIETNGNLLYKKSNVMKMIEIANAVSKKIKITLSISPKLDRIVSYGKSGKHTKDEIILEMYNKVFKNYNKYLKNIINIQCKFVHSETLKDTNEALMNNIIYNQWVTPRTKLLVMPFTPSNLDTPEKQNEWKISKDETARYALKNYIRYSPRIHIDRNME